MTLTASSRNIAGASVLLVLLALALPVTAQAQTAAERIQAETIRLEKLLATLQVPDEEKLARRGTIASIRQNLQSGNLLLSLYRLQPLWVELTAQSYAASRAGIESQGTGSFEREWQSIKATLDEKEKRLRAMPSAASSAAAVEALIESALTQVRPLYQSGRLYGLNTTITSGLFYIGLATAHLDFSIFCRELRLERNGKPLPVQSLRAELSKLETSVLEAYSRMDSPENQPQFIRLNSTLKMALELDTESRARGALLKYMEATLYLSLLTTPGAGGEKDLARLNAESRSTESRLKRAGVDHSIALIFSESAKAALEDAARGRADAERLKRAAVIIDRLLPSYFEIMSGAK